MIKLTIEDEEACGDGKQKRYQRKQIAFIEHQHGVRDYKAYSADCDDTRKSPLHGILISSACENRKHCHKSDEAAQSCDNRHLLEYARDVGRFGADHPRKNLPQAEGIGPRPRARRHWITRAELVEGLRGVSEKSVGRVLVLVVGAQRPL